MGVTKSTNTTGNPYHKSEDGKFTSPGNAGESSYNEEFDKQAISFNPKIYKLGKAFIEKIPFENLDAKQKRSITDYLIYSTIFEEKYGAQITEALGEKYIKAMLPVKNVNDDVAGNDFFIFTKDGEREGIDLKTFSSARGTIKIGLMMTDPPGSNYITEDYFLNTKKRNKYYAFQSIDFLNNEINNELFYNEALEGKDVAQRASSGCTYLIEKKSLNLFFEQNGLNKNIINELCSYTEKGLMSILKDAEGQNSRFVKETYGLDYKQGKFSRQVSKNFGMFSVICEEKYNTGDISIYVEIGEGDFNDIDDVQYFDWKK